MIASLGPLAASLEFLQSQRIVTVLQTWCMWALIPSFLPGLQTPCQAWQQVSSLSLCPAHFLQLPVTAGKKSWRVGKHSNVPWWLVLNALVQASI